MSRAEPNTAVRIVHYINPTETVTLCGLEKKPEDGPSWYRPAHQDSKKYVDCPLCIQTHTQQKNPS